MADVGFVLLMIGFVVLAALFTIACDKIIGPDEVALTEQDNDRSEADRERAVR